MKIWNSPFAIQLRQAFSHQPLVVHQLTGFEVLIKPAEITCRVGKDKVPLKSPSAFEVTFWPNGGNPEYPADKPSTVRFAVALDSSQGFTASNLITVPAGSRFTRFEVVEEFYDRSKAMGRRTRPDHHYAALQAYYTDVNGKEHASFTIGSYVRKSDREAPNWDAFLNSRTLYM